MVALIASPLVVYRPLEAARIDELNFRANGGQLTDDEQAELELTSISASALSRTDPALLARNDPSILN